MLSAHVPYIVPPEKHFEDLPVIGDFTLQPFGAIVAVGVLIGMNRCIHYAKKRDIDEFMARDLIFWILLFGFVISHWISVLFYFPEKVAEDPKVLLYIWNGLSSVGGFFGAGVGMVWFLKRNKQPILPYADMLIFGLLIGETIGRLGCTVVHDHPGKIVEPGTFLAVGPWPCRCPTGRALPDCCSELQQVWRYDLGLMEFLFLIPMTLFFYFVYKWDKSKPGKMVGWIALLYGVGRFMLDYGREYAGDTGTVGTPDMRYLGLTPAQYFALAFFSIGVYLVFIRKPKDSDMDWAKDSDRIAREQAEAEGADGDDDDDGGADEDPEPEAASADASEAEADAGDSGADAEDADDETET